MSTLSSLLVILAISDQRSYRRQGIRPSLRLCVLLGQTSAFRKRTPKVALQEIERRFPVIVPTQRFDNLVSSLLNPTNHPHPTTILANITDSVRGNLLRSSTIGALCGVGLRFCVPEPGEGICAVKNGFLSRDEDRLVYITSLLRLQPHPLPHQRHRKQSSQVRK